MQRTDRNPIPAVAEHVRSAKAHVADGNHQAALADLDLAFLIAPGDPVIHFLRGQSLSMLGRTEAALDQFDAAIERDPSIADACLERAAIHLDLSDYSRADSDCSRALELDGTLARAWSIRGTARYKLGRFDAAAADLTQALDRQPDDPSAHYWRGLARRDSGQNVLAIADFNTAIALNDRYTEAYVARGKAHSNLGDLAAARSDWAVAAQMLHQSH